MDRDTYYRRHQEALVKDLEPIFKSIYDHSMFLPPNLSLVELFERYAYTIPDDSSYEYRLIRRFDSEKGIFQWFMEATRFPENCKPEGRLFATLEVNPNTNLKDLRVLRDLVKSVYATSDLPGIELKEIGWMRLHPQA